MLDPGLVLLLDQVQEQEVADDGRLVQEAFGAEVALVAESVIERNVQTILVLIRGHELARVAGYFWGHFLDKKK